MKAEKNEKLEGTDKIKQGNKVELKAKCLLCLKREDEGIEQLLECLKLKGKNLFAMMTLAEKMLEKSKLGICFFLLLKAKYVLRMEGGKTSLWSHSKSRVDKKWEEMSCELKKRREEKSCFLIEEKELEKLCKHPFFGNRLLSLDKIIEKEMRGESVDLMDEEEKVEGKDPMNL